MTRRSIRDTVLDTATILATICATVLTVGFLLGQKVPAGPVKPIVANALPMPIEQWDSLRAVGHRIGPDDATLTVIEFGDYECPACAAFAEQWRAFQAAHPRDVALVFRHWPLPYHRFAYPAARLAECAARQGRFAQVHELLYARQDSLGLIPFREIGRRAGVRDTAAFSACIDAPSSVPEIERDRIAAQGVGGRGTPTLVANGVLLGIVPDSARLESLLEEAMSRRSSTGSMRKDSDR